MSQPRGTAHGWQVGGACCCNFAGSELIQAWPPVRVNALQTIERQYLRSYGAVKQKDQVLNSFSILFAVSICDNVESPYRDQQNGKKEKRKKKCRARAVLWQQGKKKKIQVRKSEIAERGRSQLPRPHRHTIHLSSLASSTITFCAAGPFA